MGSKSIRGVPHWTFLMLAIRDLLVTLILIPTTIDWMVVNIGVWGGGPIWCSIAGFVDYALALEYPLLLLALAIILYTRRYDVPEGFDVPMDEVDQLNGLNQTQQSMQHHGSRPPSVANSFATPHHPKAPSVVGSVDGYRYPPGQQGGFGRGKQPFYVAPNRPGSVTGSIEGRMAAANRMNSSNPRGGGGRLSSTPNSRPGSSASAQHSRLLEIRASHGFRASSPLHEVDETACSVGDADDLFDAASLDYPGRDIDIESPQWDVMWDRYTNGNMLR